MKREIKERIYVNGRMIYPDWKIEYANVILWSYEIWNKPDSERGQFNVELAKETALMQYTGLKDKNGKEIYEGDIVEYENGNAGYGRPREQEISRDIMPDITDYCTYNDMAIFWMQGEVIGNIYETPNLLQP